MATAQILDGKLVSDLILDQTKAKIEQLAHLSVPPKLVVILVGENPASLSYIKQKEKSALKVGLDFELIKYPETVSQQEIIKKIQQLNLNIEVHGVIVQLPLPKDLNVPLILKEISPRKDVDSFQAYNLGKMFLSKDFEFLTPCTPKGVIKLFEHYKIDVKGKNVVIVGKSNIVGKPMAVMLMNRDATVTVCHKETVDLKSHTLNADILIVAVGLPNLITSDMVKPGAVVVDIGCTKVDDKLFGDVDFEPTSQIASYITPVPGGAGPMTVACLIENTVLAYEWLHENNFNI
jgi:methylenetetrahydrofolate dehydrogenase (NADP+)/methenyltetrahydrofolate cyclohydrolase